MSYQHLFVEHDGPFATITLDRQEKRNALALDVMVELTQAFIDVAATDATGVILAANGPVFSAGHNFGDMAGASLPDIRHLFDVCTAMMNTVQSIPQVVIARVHALATAAGCQLVATCDLAIAADTARFATPGVNIGLFCSTPMVALSRAVPRKHAMEMLLTGDMIDAARAREIGLVNRVVPEAELDAATRALATQIATKSPLSLAIGKTAFYRQAELPLAEAYDYAAAVITRNMMAHDAAEGIDAFLAKRQPVWTGT